MPDRTAHRGDLGQQLLVASGHPPKCLEAGRPPAIAIGVTVEEAFLQCAKARIRSSLWNSDAWPSLAGIARPAQIWKDHLDIPDLTVDDLDAMQEEAYKNELY
jgi:hypothetical protein